MRYGITWCRKHFAQNARYSFFHADIYNSFYNPRGQLNPAEYAFPCRTDSADVVFATSVFTHMQAPEVRHYINETARILKPGGRCYFTFFLIDEDSEQSIKAGTSIFTFLIRARVVELRARPSQIWRLRTTCLGRNAGFCRISGVSHRARVVARHCQPFSSGHCGGAEIVVTERLDC